MSYVSSWSQKGSRQSGARMEKVPCEVSKLWLAWSLAATAQGDPIRQDVNTGSQPCQSRHLVHLVRSCFNKKANSGLLRISTKGEKGTSKKNLAIIIRSLQTPAFGVLVFCALLSENRFQTQPERMALNNVLSLALR